MKKLVVLILFMFMASLASAGLMFTDNSTISGSATLSLTATMADNLDYEYYLVVVNTTVGSIGEGTEVLGSATDDMTTYFGGYYRDYALYFAGISPSPGPNPLVSAAYGYVGDFGGGALNGIAINAIAFTFAGEGTIDLLVSTSGANGSYSSADSIIVTPEPMTMALLGLGGLFLRRRRA